jgi:hypothetical protein
MRGADAPAPGRDERDDGRGDHGRRETRARETRTRVGPAR